MSQAPQISYYRNAWPLNANEDGSYELQRPVCKYCGALAPYGDQRLPWLRHHEGLLHRVRYYLRRSR